MCPPIQGKPNFAAVGDDGADEKTGDVQIDMIHPGYVIGIDPHQIIRMEPGPGTTDFTPNYFPMVEFDAPDLPWMFSPVFADAEGKALPWCCLIAVESTQEVRIQPAGDRPLPSLKVPVDELPPPYETWAWAHTQITGDASDVDKALREPERSLSRLIAPSNLRPNTPYIAAVVPIFELGRLAGLGRDLPGDTDTMKFAWKPGGDASTVELPLYHSWEFATAQRGDFEFLVRQLEPRNLSDPEYDIGLSHIDVTNPGPEALELSPDDSFDDRTVRLEGALRKPGGTSDETYVCANALRELLNIDRATTPDGDQYPVIGPPIYGAWHALRWELASSPDTGKEWLYDLNLHPGYRIAAALGTQVVRKHQEELMASAWEQVGEIREANRLLAYAQTSHAVMARKLTRFDGRHGDEWLLQFTAPAHARTRMNGETIAGHVDASNVPGALLSAAFRRLTSPAGRLANKLGDTVDPSSLIEDVADGTLDVAPVSNAPDGIITVEGVPSLEVMCEQVRWQDPAILPDVRPQDDRVQQVLERISSIRDGIQRLIALLKPLWVGVVTPTVALAGFNGKQSDVFNAVLALQAPLLDVARDRLNLADVKDSFTETTAAQLHEGLLAAVDDARFRSPIPDLIAAVTQNHSDLMHGLVLLDTILSYFDRDFAADGESYLEGLLCDALPSARPERSAPNMPAVRRALDFEGALIKRINARIGGVDLSKRDIPLDRIMAYPIFPQAMYRRLKAISETYLLPGVENIPKNTLGVLETNPAFIEAYMAGLNTEMAGELQWRQYPNDRRGSYFRQFWDARTRIPKVEDEKRKDVRELHLWDDVFNERGVRLPSLLGSNTITGTGPDEEPTTDPDATTATVVLVIRGDLLRRYPRVTIYAAKARNAVSAQGDGHVRVPQWLPDDVDAESVNTDRHRFPLFKAQLEPDITCLGFSLTADEATGVTSTPSLGSAEDDWVNPDGTDSLGWFFVFEEAPGESRFGLDVAGDTTAPPAGITFNTDQRCEVEDAEGTQKGWAGMTWAHIPHDGSDPAQINVLAMQESRPYKESWHVSSVEAERRWTTDANVTKNKLPEDSVAEWGKNGADMARILWQTPVRVAVHADDLIPNERSDDNGGPS